MRGLGWKRLFQPSGPPGTTLQTVINYVTTLQPQEFFTEAALCQPEKGAVGMVKEKGPSARLQPALPAEGEAHYV